MNKLKYNELGFVSALVSLGYPVLEREMQGGKVFFLFDYDPEIERMEKDYYNNNLSVDAQTFNLQQKALKASIYQGRQ